MKQTIVSRSTMEAKLIVLGAACTKAERLKSLMNYIPLLTKHIPPISLHRDSQVAIAIAKN